VASTQNLKDQMQVFKELAGYFHSLPPESGKIETRMPQAGKELTTSLVFLLSALKGGDLRRWLGEQTMRQLQDKAPELLNRIGEAFTAARTGGFEAREPQGWNMYVIPFYQDGKVEPVYYYQKERGSDNDQNLQDQDHFLLDMKLSNLGHLQIDGLVKRQHKLTLDLIIRSEAPLPGGLPQNIRNLYLSAQEAAGFGGQITFRSGVDACVTIEPPTLSAVEDHQSIVV
jgi:hypothetical protein